MRPLAILLLPALIAFAPAVLAQPAPVSPQARDMDESGNDPASLLRQAQSSLAAGRIAPTHVLLERAETRLLTRSELASEPSRRAHSADITAIAEARAALTRGDRASAATRIGAALASVTAPPPAPMPMMTPAPGPVAPVQPWSPLAPRAPAM